MASVACHGLRGAIRSPWQALNNWRIALLFMLIISIAQSPVQRLCLSLAGFMGDGSHLICVDHSRVSLTATIGDTNLLLMRHSMGQHETTKRLHKRVGRCFSNPCQSQSR
jgi:hypothetical protein